ncbi:DUF6197 family protein [Streptomyces sp. NRRL S-813]|uniref:DUF6197 family protein n=1 Tax=Streptomyces sp. NRRL S-813 TaxID=1463919 RepID=UPI0004C244C6|nr:hypothetical protein [Streptomyces sp. NRRL S-813]
MTTAPTKTTTATPVELDLDARLAMVGAVMDERIYLAHLAIDVNTAHLPAAEPLPEVVAPPLIIPAAAPCPYTTPLAAVLYQAQARLEGGWCTGQLRDEAGAVCLIGAIRAVAASRDQADDACAVLLEAIRRDFADAETIPSWNDSQRGPRLPLLYLGRAAELAHARLI